LFLLFRRRWSLACGLLCVSVWVRPDNVLVALTVFAWLALRHELRITYAIALAVLAVGSVMTISHLAGNYGWRMLLYYTIHHFPDAGEIVPQFGAKDYLNFLYLGGRSLPSSSEFALWAMLGVMAFRRSSADVRQLLLVAGVSWGLRFLMFPSPQDRFFAWAYLLAAVAFLNAYLQPAATTGHDETTGSDASAERE